MPFAAQSRRHVHRQTRSLLTLASRQTQIARHACFSRAEESRPGDEATEAAASEAIDLETNRFLMVFFIKEQKSRRLFV